MIDHVDPFIGTAATDLPLPQRAGRDVVVAQAAGRQHPSGRHLPVRHGVGLRVLRRLPHRLRALPARTPRACPTSCSTGSSGVRASPTSSSPAPARSASTTTTSGSPRWWSRSTTSASRWALHDETAEPGYYAATLGSGIRCELTVGPRRRRPPLHLPGRTRRPGRDRLLAAAAWPSRTARTVPLRAHVESHRARASRRARPSWRACRWPIHVECDAADWRQMLWYDRRLIARRHPARLRPHPARPRCARSACCSWARPTPGQAVEVRIGFSLRGVRAGPGEPAARLRAARDDAVVVRRRSLTRTRTSRCRRWRVRASRQTARLAGAPGRSGSRRRRRPADGLRHRALPLADQAVLRRPTRARSGRRPGRSRSTSARCGTSTRPRCPLLTALFPAPGRRPAEVADPRLRGGGQLPDRLPDGPRRRPVLPAGQRARPHRLADAVRARASAASTGTGRWCHMDDRPAPRRTARTSSSTASPTRSPTRSTSPTATTAPPRSPAALGDHAPRRRSSSALAGRWVNAFDPATGLLRRLGVLRGRQVELLVPAAARHAGADRPGRRRRRRSSPCSTRSSATAPTR